VTGSHEHGNESSGFINGREFDQPNDYQLIIKMASY